MSETQKPQSQQQQLDDPVAAIKTLVLRRLGRFAQTRHQLETYLIKRGFPTESIAVVLDRFEDAGLINDVEYAAMWVRSRRLIRNSGPQALQRELRERGIAAHVIEQAVSERDGDDRDCALLLAQRKISSLGRHDAVTQIRRITGFLIRRGYNPGLASDVAREVVRVAAAQV